MTTYIKFNIILSLGILFIFSSCEYGLQESFEFVPEVDLTDPHGDKTAWEYIQSRTALNDEGNFSGEELNYMIAAIEKAGMEDLYSQTATMERTYLLLNNNAFTGSGDVISIVTGSAATSETVLDENGDPVLDGDGNEVTRVLTPEEVMERVDTPEKLEKLRTLLHYHIVDSYVDQVPTLAETEVRYIFETLIPGDDGLIAFSRDSRWRIQINRAPAPLPNTATSEWERVRRHNYVFNNGIGHYLNDPVRNKPY